MARLIGTSAGACLAACSMSMVGAASGCGSGTNSDPISVGGAGGANAGGSGGDGKAGMSSGGGSGGTIMPGDCSDVVAPADGAVIGATYPDPSQFVHDVFATCNGSFIVTGRAPLGASFQRRDGTEIVLSDATLWIASFDADGFPLWAKAASGGASASGWWSSAASFPDGSVVVGGVFGTDMTFGAGEANEVTLVAQTDHSNGYIARYDGAGAFKWARQIGPKNDARVWGVAAGPESTTFAALDTAHPEGMTVAPGELDLVLAGGDTAVVTLAEDGTFTRAAHLSSLIGGLTRLTATADGGVLVAAEASENALLAAGTADEMAIPAGLFLARLSAELTPVWVRDVPVLGNTYGTALLADGSAAFVADLADSVTLDAGEPNEVTLTNAEGERDGMVLRLNAEGQLLWAAQIAGMEEVDLYLVSAQTDGSVWVAGTYGLALAAGEQSSLVLAPGSADALTVQTSGQLHFVARFTADGKPVWVTPFTPDDDAFLRTLAISASPSSLLAVGDFSGTASFGSSSRRLTGDGTFITRVGP